MARIGILTPFNPAPDAANRNRARHGGVERYVWHLSRELAARGFDVVVLASDTETARTAYDGVEVRTSRRFGTPYGAALFGWGRLLQRTPVDLLHAQGAYPFLSEWAPLAAHFDGTPAVLTYHFDIVGRTLGQRVGARAFYWGLRRTVAAYDRAIFLSEGYLDTSPVVAGVDRVRIRLGSVGVDTERFHPIKASDRRRTILFVGRLAPFKGIHVLLDTIRDLPDWRLVLVGDGVLRPELERRIREESLPVNWRRRVTDAELLRLYNDASVTVLPSTDRQECVGTVLMESLACGTPVVASDFPGLQYVREFDGDLVPPSDREALAQAIQTVGSRDRSPKERSELAARAAERFSWTRVAGEVAQIYEELL